MRHMLKRLVREDEGVAATEYALIAALIAMVAAGAMTTLGSQVGDKYDYVETEVREASQPAQAGR